MIKISVIIPVYNVKPYLERCVKSVLSQTLKDIEIILIDDGSIDGSGKLADQLASQDPRIHVFHQENHGLSVARNIGINAATGEYVIFLDSDDEWLLSKGLEIMLRESEPDCDIIVFKRVDFWKHGRRVDSADYDINCISNLQNASSVFSYLVGNQMIQLSACFLMTRRSLLLDNGIYFPEGHFDEDISWSLHLWQFVQRLSFHNLPFYGYYHRVESITTSYSINRYRSNDFIFSKWKRSCKDGCVNSCSILSLLANLWVSLGYHIYFLKDTDKLEAFKILEKHKDLLHYAMSSKARKTAWLVKYLGVKRTSLILGKYWNLRTLITRNVI